MLDLLLVCIFLLEVLSLFWILLESQPPSGPRRNKPSNLLVDHTLNEFRCHKVACMGPPGP